VLGWGAQDHYMGPRRPMAVPSTSPSTRRGRERTAEASQGPPLGGDVVFMIASGALLSIADMVHASPGPPHMQVETGIPETVAAEGAQAFSETPVQRDDPVGWRVIDDASESYLDEHADVPHRWLLVQTLATAVMRRRVLATLGVRSGWRILDIGTGFGPIPMELAAMEAVEAIGIDVDDSVLQAADAVCVDVARRGGFVPGSQVSFVSGDAYIVEQADASIDLATARFVFQHLRDHTAAVSELARVVKTGGFTCLIDVDDGLSVTYPEPSAAYRRLTEALTARQERNGGGRRVARTLPSLLDRAGFDIVAVLVVPQAVYRSSLPGDVNRTLLVDRFVAARSDLVDGRFISANEFDDLLSDFRDEVTTGECSIEAHLAVIGRRR
jgi:ubiquinone/menaquinone biosynthesis C-methylase UbiE